MKQVWMANDGCIFESEAACSEYEQANCGVFYFSGMGKDTRELEDASVVFVRDENSYWANEYELDSGEGIKGPGWYVWSSAEERYLWWDEMEQLYQEYEDFIETKRKEGLVVNWD